MYACDRSRRQPDDDCIRQGKRKTTTRMIECPFSVFAKETNDGWVLKHRPGVCYAFHNYEPSLHPSVYPVHRQLPRTSELEALIKAGFVPKEIQTVVWKRGFLTTRQDIYNRIAEIRRDSYEGQSPIHILVNQLEGESFWSRIQFGYNGHVIAILFAHPDFLFYLRVYPEVFFFDCMYKINKYSMPLFDMIGIDATGRFFCIAFVFLNGEAEKDYIWALEQLKTLYK